MQLQDFMDKWGVDREGMREILGLSPIQISRHFFSKNAKNYQELTLSNQQRLDEIDALLTFRESIAQTPAIQRLDKILQKSCGITSK